LRVIAFCVCGVILVGAFGAVLRQSWLTTSVDRNVVASARSGVAYLHPLTGLVGELVEAQSAAVRGVQVDAAGVRTALAAVDTQDRESGHLLGTEARFAELKARVEAVLGLAPKGRGAYDAYTDVVALAVVLIRQVGDSSSLSRDPDLDSYYLMDAATIRLPDAMVLAGKASDLVVLAGDKELAGDDAIKAAIARHGVADAAEEVSKGLNKSVDATARTQLGANIAQRLDAFRTAVDTFAPPTMLAELAGTVNAAALASAARQVFATALPLSHRLLGELDALLSVRQEGLGNDLRYASVAGTAGAVAFAMLLWLLATGRSRPGRDPALEAALAGESEDPVLGTLTDARTLLDGEELVHVGRAVRPRSRERDGAQ
jgi:hypothetical protein